MLRKRTAHIMRRLAIALSILVLPPFHLGHAQEDLAKDYPKRPIRIIVGFTAGGGNDILARLVGQRMFENSGQPVIVENKPGAGAIIATDYVARSAADGYTLLVGASGAIAINPAVYTKLSYAPLRDFMPVSLIASFPLILVVKASGPINSVGELIAYAKENPNKSNYASSSATFQLATELFKMKTGMPAEHIAYRGVGDSLVSIISGNALFTIADTATAAGQIKGGQVRALAVAAQNRLPEFPDVPTLAEAGVAGVDATIWTGFLVPAATPPAIVKKLQDEVARVVALPEIRERMKDLAVIPTASSSEEFAHIIAADIDRWTAVAKAGNIKIEP